MESTSNRVQGLWPELCQLSFRHGWVDANGIGTRYMDVGDPDAPALLMLHGTGGSHETFARNYAAHSRHFRCIAIDMIGSGFSDKPDHPYEIEHYVQHAVGVLDAFGLKSASILGVSLGAWVACRLAHSLPDRVDAMTLISSAGMFAKKTNGNQVRSGRNAAAQNPTFENIHGIFEWLIYDKSKIADDLVFVRQKSYSLPGMTTGMSNILALQEPETRKRNLLSEEEWKAIACPTLFIGCPDHPDEYLETAKVASAIMPNARYVEMLKVAHWPHFEDAEVFNRHNLEFLLDVIPAAGGAR